MDPIANPFAPGAGSRPPSLAGREKILDDVRIALGRIKAGRHAKSIMMLGLRGVGKTVLLVRSGELAEERDYIPMLIEAPEEKSLAALMVPQLRVVLYRLSKFEKARTLANRALGALRSFASVFKVAYGEFEVGIEAEPAFASGDLETDFTELLIVVANAARAAERPVAILVDEVQYLEEQDLAALIVAMHKIGQKGLPVVLIGAGLPQLAALSGEIKSYAERLFQFINVGPLDTTSARDAIAVPIHTAGEQIDVDAIELIVTKTEGYPYFLQEWGSHAWNTANASPISLSDVVNASNQAVAALDDSFFRVRFDRLTHREQDYLRAMAALGKGPYRSGDIAGKLGIKVTSAGPLRTGLIKKGMVWSPSHGETEFTVPMFAEFMMRVMPDWQP
ncbi:MAG: ATP-binding protein [Bacteroidetes bacterium]|nr:ATP-binding protein [Bacteroidota bacterium]